MAKRTKREAAADDLYEPCPICDGTGCHKTREGSVECSVCKVMRVVPVGINSRQLSRLFVKAGAFDAIYRRGFALAGDYTRGLSQRFSLLWQTISDAKHAVKTQTENAGPTSAPPKQG